MDRPAENAGYSPVRRPPWQQISSRLVHSCPWFIVRKDDVVRPDGSTGSYDRVETRGAVTVLAVDGEDEVVFTRQWIYLHGGIQWRLPGGGIDTDDDNDPLVAAKRELAEETGLRAQKWQPLGKINCADSMTNHVVHLFLATELTEGAKDLGAGEQDLKVVRLPFAEAVELAMRNDVPDAGSAHALVKYAAKRAGIGKQPLDAS
jgi:8-oxo-dGDP phosphatase